jgi:hypothetical protein
LVIFEDVTVGTREGAKTWMASRVQKQLWTRICRKRKTSHLGVPEDNDGDDEGSHERR